jgi:hypothetical protein
MSYSAPAFQVVVADEDTRHKVRQLIEEEIARYVEIGYRTFLAGIGESGDEPAQRKAAEQLRHLHYAEPWLPADLAAEAVLAALTAELPL